jgi:hypothetical protein
MTVKTEELAKQETGGIEVVNATMQGLKDLMKTALKSGLDYGQIPGTKGGRPSLLQPGAEKIALMLGITVKHDITTRELNGGHREVTVVSHAISRKTEKEIGDGIGSCSTMESKYRYRSKYINGQKQRFENTDIADVYNTVAKMAEKRADIDCIKRVSGASEFFTQDVEDMPDYLTEQQKRQQPATPVADLEPVRQRFKAWCNAEGYTPQDGAAELASAVGAASMQAMTQTQVTQAVTIMDEDMSHKSQPQPAPEPQQPEVYEEDQDF